MATIANEIFPGSRDESNYPSYFEVAENLPTRQSPMPKDGATNNIPALPGSRQTVVNTRFGAYNLNEYPAPAGLPSTASTVELYRIAQELQKQNPATYGNMTDTNIVVLLQQAGKSHFVLSAIDDSFGAGARGQMNLNPQPYAANGRVPAGVYGNLGGLVSDRNQGGLHGGGTPLVSAAKEVAHREGWAGLRLYTDTDKGREFYEKNGFRVVNQEPAPDGSGRTRTHMVWTDPAPLTLPQQNKPTFTFAPSTLTIRKEHLPLPSFPTQLQRPDTPGHVVKFEIGQSPEVPRVPPMQTLGTTVGMAQTVWQTQQLERYRWIQPGDTVSQSTARFRKMFPQVTKELEARLGTSRTFEGKAGAGGVLSADTVIASLYETQAGKKPLPPDEMHTLAQLRTALMLQAAWQEPGLAAPESWNRFVQAHPKEATALNKALKDTHLTQQQVIEKLRANPDWVYDDSGVASGSNIALC